MQPVLNRFSSLSPGGLVVSIIYDSKAKKKHLSFFSLLYAHNIHKIRRNIPYKTWFYLTKTV